MKNLCKLSIFLLLVCVSCENEKTDDDIFDNTGTSYNRFCRGSSADKNTIIGEGPVIEHTYNLSDFHGVQLVGAYQSVIHTGNENQDIKIKAQQNILDVLEISVKNDVLTVELQDNTCVETDSIIKVNLKIKDDLDDISIVGSADLSLAGPSQDNCSFSIVGAGNVNALDLPLQSCSVIVSGAGALELKVESTLNIVVSGTASINYVGDPVVNQTISGIASIEKIN